MQKKRPEMLNKFFPKGIFPFFSVVLALKSSYFSISCQIDVKYFSILVFCQD